MKNNICIWLLLLSICLLSCKQQDSQLPFSLSRQIDSLEQVSGYYKEVADNCTKDILMLDEAVLKLEALSLRRKYDSLELQKKLANCK